MPFVTSTEMFKKAYDGHYAVGAFNVNNMEIIQGICDAAKAENSPFILQVSAGARKYAKHSYLVKLVEAAMEDTGLPICLFPNLFPRGSIALFSLQDQIQRNVLCRSRKI